MQALNSSAYFELEGMVSKIQQYIHDENYSSAEMLCNACLMAKEHLSLDGSTFLFYLASEVIKGTGKKDVSPLYLLEFEKRFKNNSQASQSYSS